MLLLVFASAISMALGANPWFCHGLNCPTFTQLDNITENGQTIDMRKYPAQLWVSTNITDEELKIPPICLKRNTGHPCTNIIYNEYIYSVLMMH